MGHNQIFEWKSTDVLGSLTALTQLNLAGNPLCDLDNYFDIIRQLCPKVKIFDGRKIVDDLRRRKKRKRNDRNDKYQPDKKRQKTEDSKFDKNVKTDKKKDNVRSSSPEKKKVAPKPTVLRGRVSSGKYVNFDDDSDDEVDAFMDESDGNNETEVKTKSSENFDKQDKSLETESGDSKKTKEKTQKELALEAEKILQEKKTKSSGVLSVVEVKKKKSDKKKFSISDLTNAEELGSGTSQW